MVTLLALRKQPPLQGKFHLLQHMPSPKLVFSADMKSALVVPFAWPSWEPWKFGDPSAGACSLFD